MILMVIGVCGYSFAIGSITNVLSSMDKKEAMLKEKIGILDDIKDKYNINPELYMQILKQLKFDHTKNTTGELKLLDELPFQLKCELSFILHREIIEKIPFFQGKPKDFISVIGPLLKPMRALKGDYIYKKDEPTDEIYFLIQGSIGFILDKNKTKKKDVFVKVKEGTGLFSQSLIRRLFWRS
jgi:hypothetical protein